jgi:predicted  nucleic acid-binding Zn-ribbon protein
MTVTNAQILAAITVVNKKLDALMTQQDDIDADVQTLGQEETDLATASTAIEDEIAALKAANPALDLTALDAKVASLKTAVSGVAAIAPASTPPAPAAPAS